MKSSEKRYVLDTSIEQVEEDYELAYKESETHYIFGISGIFSFDESASIFCIIVKEDETEVLHQFQRKNSIESAVNEMGRREAVSFLQKMGYEPFMRLDIERSYYDDNKGDSFIVEEVDQLGVFTDREELGGEEVYYAEELKNDMIGDSERKEEITDQAKCIIRSVGS